MEKNQGDNISLGRNITMLKIGDEKYLGWREMGLETNPMVANGLSIKPNREIPSLVVGKSHLDKVDSGMKVEKRS